MIAVRHFALYSEYWSGRGRDAISMFILLRNSYVHGKKEWNFFSYHFHNVYQWMFDQRLKECVHLNKETRSNLVVHIEYRIRISKNI